MIDPGIDHLERLLERADWLRTERKDREWERAMEADERDEEPSEPDCFAIAKEWEFMEQEREAREAAERALEPQQPPSGT